MFRSFDAIKRTMRSSSETSIGLPEEFKVPDAGAVAFFFPAFFFLFNVATLEGLFER